MKALCLGGILAIVGMVGATSEPTRHVDREVSPKPHSEMSAARKTVRRKVYVVDSRSPYYLRPGVRPSFGYIGPPGYAGEYAWRKSIGQCVEDLGYGRWSACGSR